MDVVAQKRLNAKSVPTDNGANEALAQQLSAAKEEAHIANERYQNLYLWEKRTRETLQCIRQSLQLEGIFNRVVEEVGSILNVDRCFILEFDEAENPLPVRFYYGTPTAGSFVGLTPPWFYCPYMKQAAKHKTAFTQDAFDDASVEFDPRWYHFSRQYNIRGAMVIPFLFGKRILACLVLHTTAPRQWHEEEIFFAKTIVTHMAPTIFQAELAKQLERSAQLKNLFLANMSHELKTPLTSMLGYAGMLAKNSGMLSKKQQQHVQNIIRSGQHLLNLVNSVLDFTQLEAQKITLEPQPLEIKPLLEEVEGMLAGVAEEKKVKLIFNLPADLISIDADPIRLRQILINIISNGVKFNRENGEVQTNVSLSPDKQWIYFAIKDTGIGMSGSTLTKLYTAFYQADSSLSRKIEGAGLGLALTKRLIELHQGKISVMSEEGVGSTFTVKIPTFYSRAE